MDDLRFLDPEALVNRAVFNERFGMLNDLMFGLGNEYLWEKNLVEATYDVDKRYNENMLNLVGSSVSVYYSDSIQINTTDKTANLVNPQLQNVTYGEDLSFLVGKYWVNGGSANLSQLYYIPDGASISGVDVGGGSYRWTASEYQILSNFRNKYTFISYVNSSSPDAYPPAEPDGYTYTALGQVGDRTRIVIGSYVGTGTSGQGNPNNIVTGFPVKLLLIAKKSDGLSAQDRYWYNSAVWFDGTDGSPVARADNLCKFTATDTGVSWYSPLTGADLQLNTSGVTYAYVALG